MSEATLVLPGPIYDGDPFTIPVAFWTTFPTNPDDPSTGTVRDMSGVRVGVTIKEYKNDDDAHAIFKLDLVGDATGHFNFPVPGLITCTYWIDAKMWVAGQRSSVVPTQQFEVLPSVTGRTAPAV